MTHFSIPGSIFHPVAHFFYPVLHSGPSSRQVSQVEVVTFQDPRKKLKTKQTPTLDKVPNKVPVRLQYAT